MGMTLVVFVLFLAITGIALNHATDLGLDRRNVSWSWLLNAYGFSMPLPSASFEDAGYRATLVGEHLYLGDNYMDRQLQGLTGIVVMEPLILIGGVRSAQLRTTGGDLVEILDLGGVLAGTIERVGRKDNRAVLQSGERLYISDADIAVFSPWDGEDKAAVFWSEASAPEAQELARLETAWRGRGLTVERVLLDLHSGRLFALSGKVLLDFVGIGMILLSVSGLALWRRRNRRNGNGK